jgi:hypothetical protein
MQYARADALRFRLPAPWLAFGKETAPAAGRQCPETDDNDRASQKPVNPTRHVRDNAVEVVNGSSKSMACRKPLWISAFAMVKKCGRGIWGFRMRARLILSVLMSSVMVFMVTLVATYANLGFVTGFFGRWMKAYLMGWPVAATTAFLIMPIARRMTDRLMALIEPIL